MFFFCQAVLKSRSEALSDKAYHKIFETLFRISETESSNFARSPKAPARTQAASRLSACAGVLRVAVEVGVRKLRYKTVRALVDHVVQTLPTADDGYCAPLVPDYFKILRTVLGYEPHLEHFPSDVWNELTDFCVAVVNDLTRMLEDGDSSLSHRLRASDSFQDNPSRSVTPSLRVNSSRKSTQNASQHSEGTTLRDSSENIVLCLKYLHSVPSAPVSEKAEGTLQAMLDLLRKSPNVSHTQQAAFDCINSILARIITDDTILALETVKSVLPLICRFWQAKSHALKDSMMISLLYGEHFFRRLVLLDISGEHTTILESLLEIFKDDYCKRIERDTLQMEDLDLSQESIYSERQAPLSLRNFRPRFGLVKAEQPWALLHISSSIVIALDINVTVQENQDINDDATHISKRRKFNSARGDIVQQIKASPPSEKQYSLQVLGFLLNAINLDSFNMQESLDILLSCISDSNESSASWAMLALSW
jgi:ataxia telangiectasia mutated family protein